MLGATAQEIQGWAPVCSATATALAVLVALFGGTVREWLRRPRLALREFDTTSADGWILQETTGARIVFVRLRVQNAGRSEARDVEVTVERLTDQTPADIASARSDLGRRMEAGLAGRQLKWADRDVATIDIPAGTVRRFDLFAIFETDAVEQGDDKRAVPLRIGLFADSLSGRHILPHTRFALTISVAGSNFRPMQQEIFVSFSGIWDLTSNDWSAIGPSLEVQLVGSRPRSRELPQSPGAVSAPAPVG